MPSDVEHRGRGLHLVDSPRRVDAGALQQSLEKRRTGRLELGDQVGPQPVLQSGTLGGANRLDDDRRDPFHRHTAQQLARRCVARSIADHFDRSAERSKRRPVAFGARSGHEYRRAQPTAGHRSHQSDVGERSTDRRGRGRRAAL